MTLETPTIAGIDQYWTTIEVDIEDVYKALEKNGFEHMRGAWVDLAGDKKGGCVLGQAAMNLGVYPSPEAFAFNGGPNENWWDRYLNDGGDVEDAYNRARQDNLLTQLNQFVLDNPDDNPWTPVNDYGSTGYPIGTVIIYWNDLVERDEQGYATETYVLRTYKDVAWMAYDVMKPHFGKKITVATYDYS